MSQPTIIFGKKHEQLENKIFVSTKDFESGLANYETTKITMNEMKYKVTIKKKKLNLTVKQCISLNTAPTARHPQLIKLAVFAILSLHFAFTVSTIFEFYLFK